MMLRLSHDATQQQIRLIAPLAVKVSARNMEKRTNTYRPIRRVWVTSRLHQNDIQPPVKIVRSPTIEITGTPAAAVGVKPAAEASVAAAASKSYKSSNTGSHPFGISSVFSRSTRTCPPPALKTASRESKVEYEKRKDRTIGIAPIQFKPSRMLSITGLSIGAAMSRIGHSLAIEYEPVKVEGREGLFEYVTTKGGGNESRPAQM